jgi:hypothetical protein
MDNKIVYSGTDYRILASGDVKRNDPDIYIDVDSEMWNSKRFHEFVRTFIKDYAKIESKKLKTRRLI